MYNNKLNPLDRVAAKETVVVHLCVRRGDGGSLEVLPAGVTQDVEPTTIQCLLVSVALSTG